MARSSSSGTTSAAASTPIPTTRVSARRSRATATRGSVSRRNSSAWRAGPCSSPLPVPEDLAGKGSEEARPGALRLAPPSRRRLLVRHLHAGRASAAPRRTGAGSHGPEEDPRRGRVAVGVRAHDLLQRCATTDAGVRRLPGAQPRIGDSSARRPGKSADIAGSFGSATPIFRTDVDAPVLDIQSEADVIGVLNSVEVRQPDNDRFRLWEVAGTAHADVHLLGPIAKLLDCGAPINNAPMYLVANAALHSLDDWVSSGTAPPEAPRLELTTGSNPASRRDADGIALGGIRTPPVDVPVDVLSGIPGSNPDLLCILLGSTKPLPAARLAQLYPSRAAYQQRYDADADKGDQGRLRPRSRPRRAPRVRPAVAHTGLTQEGPARFSRPRTPRVRRLPHARRMRRARRRSRGRARSPTRRATGSCRAAWSRAG